MNLALINGSPKIKNSASEIVLESLKRFLSDEDMFFEYDFKVSRIENSDLEKIAESNIIILAFPLYVDGIPSHLLHCLVQMEQYFRINPKSNIYVFGIVNCGFYEGRQGSLALEMISNWCDKSGLNWCQGISIGCGGMLSMLPNASQGKGPWKKLIIAFRLMAENVIEHKVDDNILVTPSIPRFVYKIGGDASWRSQAKANGLRKKDLFRKIN